MKKVTCLFFALFTLLSFPAHALVSECESLEIRNRTLLNINRKNFLCAEWLSDSQNHIQNACDALALSRTFFAKYSLHESFLDLRTLRKFDCKRDKDIKALREDVNLFSVSF